MQDFNFRRNFDETGDGTVIGIVQGGFDYELAPSFVVGVFADATFGDLGIDRNNNDDHFFDQATSVPTVVSRRTGVPWSTWRAGLASLPLAATS